MELFIYRDIWLCFNYKTNYKIINHKYFNLLCDAGYPFTESTIKL